MPPSGRQGHLPPGTVAERIQDCSELWEVKQEKTVLPKPRGKRFFSGRRVYSSLSEATERSCWTRTNKLVGFRIRPLLITPPLEWRVIWSLRNGDSRDAVSQRVARSVLYKWTCKEHINKTVSSGSLCVYLVYYFALLPFEKKILSWTDFDSRLHLKMELCESQTYGRV